MYNASTRAVEVRPDKSDLQSFSLPPIYFCFAVSDRNNPELPPMAPPAKRKCHAEAGAGGASSAAGRRRAPNAVEDTM